MLGDDRAVRRLLAADPASISLRSPPYCGDAPQLSRPVQVSPAGSCPLDLGVPIAALEGDGYWDLAPGTTALHVAALKGIPSTVELLIERGAPVNAADGKGRTPLMFAVKATVDSYWTERRTPESVGALLQAGASVESVRFPSGYAEVDQLLQRYGARPAST